MLEGDEVIRKGDMLWTDFGITYLGLNTDTQHLAYVLKDGEREVPKGLRDGMKAAMPPMACAPRRWQVCTSSSVYARMNGTVIVTWARSGRTNSARVRNFLMTLKM